MVGTQFGRCVRRRRRDELSVGRGEGPWPGEATAPPKFTGCEDPRSLGAGQSEEERDGVEAGVQVLQA